MKRVVGGMLAAVALLTGLAWAKLPMLRTYDQLNSETKLWVSQIEKVMADGKGVGLNRKEPGAEDRMREILGPHIPMEKVGGLELGKDGSFALKFTKEHVVDLPTEDRKFIRVTIKEGLVKGKLTEAKTIKRQIPLKVFVFSDPKTIIIDPLNEKRESTVPGIAKMMGLLPNIIALVYYEGDEKRGPLVAPQLNGMGTSENARLMKDLLFLDDTLLPEFAAATPK